MVDALQLAYTVIADADVFYVALLLCVGNTVPESTLLPGSIVLRRPVELADVDGAAKTICGALRGIDDGPTGETPGVWREFGGDDEVGRWIAEVLAKKGFGASVEGASAV